MSFNITGSPANVVNVGDEITQDIVDALNGSVSASAVNPFATIADVGGGGGGSYLPLSGGTMTGDITFGTGYQYIGEGNFDTFRGGSNGLSLVCSVGYEFNWQAGWLTTTEQNSTTPRPLYLDGGAGTTLVVAGTGHHTQDVTVSHNGITLGQYTTGGITFADGSVQTTAAGGGGGSSTWTYEALNINASSWSLDATAVITDMHSDQFNGWTDAIAQSGLFKTKFSLNIVASNSHGIDAPFLAFHYVDGLQVLLENPPTISYTDTSLSGGVGNQWRNYTGQTSQHSDIVWSAIYDVVGSYEAYVKPIPSISLTSGGTIKSVRMSVQVEPLI